MGLGHKRKWGKSRYVYFFRMVLINGTHLDRYMGYATLRTSPQTSYIQKNYRWYKNF
ncbi:MAG: hypothetical protein CM1200mP7_1290 [Chloroflexota bacterium]|nr:MAG: hypothetical protein CM1200mP7_1290 [Chloroflexota bacterium]